MKVENRRIEVVKTKGRERPEAGEDAEFPPFGRMWWFVEGLGGHTPRPSAKLGPRCP